MQLRLFTETTDELMSDRLKLYKVMLKKLNTNDAETRREVIAEYREKVAVIDKKIKEIEIQKNIQEKIKND